MSKELLSRVKAFQLGYALACDYYTGALKKDYYFFAGRGWEAEVAAILNEAPIPWNLPGQAVARVRDVIEGLLASQDGLLDEFVWDAQGRATCGPWAACVKGSHGGTFVAWLELPNILRGIPCQVSVLPPEGGGWLSESDARAACEAALRAYGVQPHRSLPLPVVTPWEQDKRFPWLQNCACGNAITCTLMKIKAGSQICWRWSITVLDIIVGQGEQIGDGSVAEERAKQECLDYLPTLFGLEASHG